MTRVSSALFGRLRLCGHFGLVVGLVVGLLFDLLRLQINIPLTDALIVWLIFTPVGWLFAAVFVLLLGDISVIASFLASVGNALVVSIITVLVLMVLPHWPIGPLVGTLLGAVIGNALCIWCPPRRIRK